MRNLFDRQLKMLLRVWAFGQKYVGLFSAESLAGSLFRVIGSAVPMLTSGAQAASVARTREKATQRADCREALIVQLRTIGATGRAIAREDTKLRETFLIPNSPSDQNLITFARGFAENAEAIKAQFIAHEMEPAFSDELKTTISQFEAAIVAHNDARSEQTKTTATIEEVVDRAMDAVKRLDGIVPNKLRNDYPTLKEWQVARRIPRARLASSEGSNSEEISASPPATPGPEAIPHPAADPPTAVAT